MSAYRVIIPALLVLFMIPATGDTPLQVTLQGHKFLPAEIHVKANQPNVISLTNKDDTVEEFDSPALKVEKVVGGHSEGDVRLRPLAPGSYPFTGEFHAETAHGVVIAE